MKNPITARRDGAFQMCAFTHTFASSVNATSAPPRATTTEARFRWDHRSNSIEQIKIEKGIVQ